LSVKPILVWSSQSSLRRPSAAIDVSPVNGIGLDELLADLIDTMHACIDPEKIGRAHV
jgi:hypothetical protein